MIRVSSPHRLARWFLPALLLGLLGLAACGLGSTQASIPTAAEILQHATTALNLSDTAKSTDNATVKDLTFKMSFTVNMNMTSSTLGTQKITETMSATGKETLKPRRSQMDMTMNMSGLDLGQNTGQNTPQNITSSVITDYATETGYVKMSGLSGLPGMSSGKWYKMSYGSLGGLGADTSMYTDYSKLKDAKLIGSETLNGVPVWHLQAKEDVNSSSVPGATGASASASASSSDSAGMKATVDYYFRKDNYRPVKIVLAGTDDLASLGTMAMNGEMDFTSFNTGVSITLPPANEVQPLQY